MPGNVFHPAPSQLFPIGTDRKTTKPATSGNLSPWHFQYQSPIFLFYVTDRTSGLQYIIDTGADVSVLPPSCSERQKPAPLKLQAVNHSSILYVW